MMRTKIIKIIKNKIRNGEVISPFLFISQNTEILNSEINNLALELLSEFDIPKEYLYVLSDRDNQIRIAELKQFLIPSNSKPVYKIQIFLIENIGRMTLQSANSTLKLLEEPGVGNIIFLTNKSENNVLETILSRVQIIENSKTIGTSKDNFFYSLIDSYKQNKSPELFAYFFRLKAEKEEYIKFLQTLIIYSKENLVFLDIIEEIDSDIYAIYNNNVNARNIVNKYLGKI